jgi:hypothetical protein
MFIGRSALACISVVLSATFAFPCQRADPVSSVDVVRQADLILRVLALEYAIVPRNLNERTTGEPDSRVRFKVLEVIRGGEQSELILPGYLTETDDFNDQPSPYNFVRPTGRHGSCFANSYRVGAQFLLLLKRSPSGEPTVNWYALGPTNEQLHSPRDPWLHWVKEQVQKQSARTRK